MRWIFVTLILLNLLFFGWSYWQKNQESSNAQTAVEQATPSAAAEGEDLVLLTERLPKPTSPSPPPTIGPEKPKVTPPAMPVPVKEPERSLCAKIGPYKDSAQGNQLVQVLAASGNTAALSEAQEEVGAQYWVILPAESTRRRALQTLRELQARKVDSYLINNGEMKNAISLGLFSREELAKGVQEKIREVGYAAEIRKKEKVEKVYWVQMIAKQPFENAQKVLETAISKKDGIKITNTPCEMFAQSN